jgi:hypothetical protein
MIFVTAVLIFSAAMLIYSVAAAGLLSMPAITSFIILPFALAEFFLQINGNYARLGYVGKGQIGISIKFLTGVLLIIVSAMLFERQTMIIYAINLVIALIVSFKMISFISSEKEDFEISGSFLIELLKSAVHIMQGCALVLLIAPMFLKRDLELQIVLAAFLFALAAFAVNGKILKLSLKQGGGK